MNHKHNIRLWLLTVIACVIVGSLFLSPPRACAEEATPYLPATPDAGRDYLDSMIFFGESTTAHLRARGVLSGGKKTDRVWADESGTRMLSSRITSEPIVYPPTGEHLTVADACRLARPQILVLSFGLNGVMKFASDRELYLASYGRLIEAVRAASPDTRILIQTVYPVSRADAYSVDVDTLNAYILRLNEWLPALASRYENLRVVDTASALRDADGRLCAAYAEADGIHLTRAAYEAVLAYLRTHAWR